MTLDEFKASTASAEPPSLSPPLQALWHDRRGDWDQAHEAAQSHKSPEAAWVHAYLHRKEGDLGNARYWYNRARKPESRDPLEKEWDQIAGALLEGP